jgi:hypothetical protein
MSLIPVAPFKSQSSDLKFRISDFRVKGFASRGLAALVIFAREQSRRKKLRFTRFRWPLGFNHVSERFYVVQSLHAGKSEDRVELGGATRGQIAGEKRDDDKQKRNREIRGRIIRSHMEK